MWLDAVGSMCDSILLMGFICMAFWVACLGLWVYQRCAQYNELMYMSECVYFSFSGDDKNREGDVELIAAG